MATIQFLGATRTVTGSKFLVEHNGKKLLLDCGLYQGPKELRLRNWEGLPFGEVEVDAIVLTHTHLDHAGYTPLMTKRGFLGPIYATPPTAELLKILLPDAAHLAEEEAFYANKEGFSKHKPALPLFNQADAQEAIGRLRRVPYDEWHDVLPGFAARFHRVGHILGSAIIRVEAEGKTVVFSGDLGNSPAPIIQPTEKLSSADYCLIESTYGNRLHEGLGDRQRDLESAIESTVKDGGVLMIPAFALERTQDILFHLNELFEKGRVPKVPVFIDSPLAIKLTAIYRKYENHFNKEVLKLERDGDDIFNFPGLHFTLTTEQSKEINNVPAPKIIMAGSGMSNGGRILHHEMRYLSDPKSTILFVGYQTVGSMGRQILNGAKSVRIFGEEIPVRCRVKEISAYSAHADQGQLLDWLKPLRLSLKKVFVVQGEEGASEVLAGKIRDNYAIEAVVPEAGDKVMI